MPVGPGLSSESRTMPRGVDGADPEGRCPRRGCWTETIPVSGQPRDPQPADPPGGAAAAVTQPGEAGEEEEEQQEPPQPPQPPRSRSPAPPWPAG